MIGDLLRGKEKYFALHLPSFLISPPPLTFLVHLNAIVVREMIGLGYKRAYVIISKIDFMGILVLLYPANLLLEF